MNQNKVLILNAYFFPGYKSGGPQQTIANIIDTFGKIYDFYVLTQNHDYGEKDPYMGWWVRRVAK